MCENFRGLLNCAEEFKGVEREVISRASKNDVSFPNQAANEPAAKIDPYHQRLRNLYSCPWTGNQWQSRSMHRSTKGRKICPESAPREPKIPARGRASLESQPTLQVKPNL